MHDHWQCHPKVVVNEMGEGAALYQTATGRMHLLNDSAIWIWRNCESLGIQGLVAALCESYEAEEGQVTQDVTSTLQHFLLEQLVTGTEPQNHG